MPELICSAPFCEKANDLRGGYCWTHQSDEKKQPCNAPFCDQTRHPRKGYCFAHAYEFEKNKIKAYKELIPLGFYMRCKVHGLLSRRKDVGHHSYGVNGRKRFRCHKCTNERSRKQRLKNPDKELLKGRKHSLKNKFGLSLDCYEELNQSQGDACAICKKKESAINHVTKNVRALSVDHCHDTGKVRGLLCSKCNFGVGYFDNSIEYLESAIDYLRPHQ